MALYDLSVDNTIIVLAGVGILSDWGRTDPPFTIEQIDDTGTLSRGLGGNAAGYYRKNPGLRLTVNMMPGSPQAFALQAANNAKQVMSGGYESVQNLEGAVLAEGIFTRPKSISRGGPGMNDATFVMEFNSGNIV
jgi:hypothetical protein